MVKLLREMVLLDILLVMMLLLALGSCLGRNYAMFLADPEPSRTSERTPNGAKTCFQISSINSVPNPVPISGSLDIPFCASSGISAHAFTFCQRDSPRCDYGCADGGCSENPAIA
jgi:hypothetical protein